jgi:hypothetical protein
MKDAEKKAELERWSKVATLLDAVAEGSMMAKEAVSAWPYHELGAYPLAFKTIGSARVKLDQQAELDSDGLGDVLGEFGHQQFRTLASRIRDRIARESEP